MPILENRPIVGTTRPYKRIGMTGSSCSTMQEPTTKRVHRYDTEEMERVFNSAFEGVFVESGRGIPDAER